MDLLTTSERQRLDDDGYLVLEGIVPPEPVKAMRDRLEEIVQSWIVDLLHLPEGSGAGFVTGTTMANFSALAAARTALLQHAGWNVEEDGLFGAPPIRVIVGDEVHVSLLKALSMLGLGRSRVVRLPTDDQGRMCADALCASASPVGPQLMKMSSAASRPWSGLPGRFAWRFNRRFSLL